jgi:hypothetical protein
MLRRIRGTNAATRSTGANKTTKRQATETKMAREKKPGAHEKILRVGKLLHSIRDVMRNELLDQFILFYFILSIYKFIIR